MKTISLHRVPSTLQRCTPTLGILALLAGCAAPGANPSAQTETAAPAAKVAAAPTTADTVVCRREVPTAMRIATTVCRRVGDIEKRAKEDREAMERIPAELPSER